MPLLDTLSGNHGVGPVCHELNIAPSTYFRHREYRQHPEKRSQRDHRDDQLKPEIQRVYDENYSVYGIRKVWRQLQREGFSVARCTIARLIKAMGLAGVLRGKKVRTTVSRKDVAASDRVNHQFVAERPNQLWVADFTYVSTCQGLPVWRSSSTCSQVLSWAGGCHRRWKPRSYWMRWSRPCGHGDRPGLSITRTKARSIVGVLAAAAGSRASGFNGQHG